MILPIMTQPYRCIISDQVLDNGNVIEGAGEFSFDCALAMLSVRSRMSILSRSKTILNIFAKCLCYSRIKSWLAFPALSAPTESIKSPQV